LKAYNLPMIGTCKHCGLIFEVKLIHNGFNYSSYAYCDTCGITALLSGWAKRWPQGVEFIQAEIPVEMEAHLAPCTCGGKFTKGNAPRCRNCRQPIDAKDAAVYLEERSPGTKSDRWWQCNWHGLYCVIIEDRKVEDNFRES
jgi:hypothetical protein